MSPPRLPLIPLGHHETTPSPEPDESRYWIIATYVLLAVVAVLMVATVADYGITWDEFKHDRYGRHVRNPAGL